MGKSIGVDVPTNGLEDNMDKMWRALEHIIQDSKEKGLNMSTSRLRMHIEEATPFVETLRNEKKVLDLNIARYETVLSKLKGQEYWREQGALGVLITLMKAHSIGISEALNIMEIPCE